MNKNKYRKVRSFDPRHDGPRAVSFSYLTHRSETKFQRTPHNRINNEVGRSSPPLQVLVDDLLDGRRRSRA